MRRYAGARAGVAATPGSGVIAAVAALSGGLIASASCGSNERQPRVMAATSAAKSSLLLLDAFADDEEHEAVDAGALRLDDRVDGFLVVLDERLGSSVTSARNLATAPSTIFSTMLAGLPDSAARAEAIVALLLDDVGRHVLAADGHRLRRRDVHREILAERFVAARVVDEDADARAVHVRRDTALRFQPHEAPQRQCSRRSSARALRAAPRPCRPTRARARRAPPRRPAGRGRRSARLRWRTPGNRRCVRRNRFRS